LLTGLYILPSVSFFLKLSKAISGPIHRKYLLSTAFANYFTINSAVHLYNTRVRENLHLDSVTTNYGKRTVKYKLWNQLPSSLKEFLSVKNFSNKLKKFLQIVDIDNTV